MKQVYRKALAGLPTGGRWPAAPRGLKGEGGGTAVGTQQSHDLHAFEAPVQGCDFKLKHGAVVIAAITSLHQHSNPAGAGRRRPAGAQGARQGLATKPG